MSTKQCCHVYLEVSSNLQECSATVTRTGVKYENSGSSKLFPDEDIFTETCICVCFTVSVQ